MNNQADNRADKQADNQADNGVDNWAGNWADNRVDNRADNQADNRADVNEKKLPQLCLYKERKKMGTTKRCKIRKKKDAKNKKTQNGYDGFFFYKSQNLEPKVGS